MPIYQTLPIFEEKCGFISNRYFPAYMDQGFSFGDTADILYYDYNGSIYKVDNLQEMSQSNFTIEPHITKLENMHPCRMLTYYNNTIYCSVQAGEIGKTIEDWDNQNIRPSSYVAGKTWFIIAQALNQPSPQDYRIINKAPLSGAPHLTVIDDTYIVADNVVINMKSGRIVKDAPTFGLGGESDLRAVRYYGDQ